MWYNVFVFLVNWILFTYVTSGTALPCGIFLPCMLIGCAIGILYHPLHMMIFSYDDPNDNLKVQTAAILGAAAVLSGATRMTYCLVVLMMETASNVELFLPIIFTIFISYGSGFILMPRSIYKGALRQKNIPILNKSLPK
jgi:H+/Cl- antiporter ClcA